MITLENFRKVFEFATEEKYSFLVINFEAKESSKMFRKNWDEYIEFP